MKKILFIFLLAIVAGLAPVKILAQEAQTQDSPIIEKKSILDEIAEVKRTYKGQLAEYRQAESQSAITKGQFEQLNTLVSLEVAVQDMRKAMVLRTQVLSTYLKLIELELLDADGINLEEKDAALEMTKALQKDFATHRDFLETAVDREKIDLAADDFEILVPRITNLSQYASNLLKIGRLQTVYDQLVTLVTETDPESKISDSGSENAESSIDLNEKIRAHVEIKNLMSEIDANLKFIWTEIKNSRSKNREAKIEKESSSVYAGLSQVLVFLEEVLKKN